MRQPVPFGKYLLLDRISVGGMAEVFKAKSYGVEGFEKIIAIKRILPTMGEDRDFIKMFIDEAKITGQLAHANICQIFELGRIDGSHFIAMEYIWGKDLLQLQNRARKNKISMPIPMACFVIAKVLEGLDYAHRKRDALGRPLEIVHRDCSPQNVLVSYEGEVKVIDFGIAKATSRNSRTMAGVLKGKFGYMSPEQVRGLPLDRRSDIFAIGTMLYECLTGERLFAGETDFSTLEKVRNVDIQRPRAINPSIPEAVERIILKALAKDVDDRYQWCSEMLADLQQFLMGQDVVFTAKSLSQWVKDQFATELDRERQLLEQYKRVGRDGLVDGAPAASAKVDLVATLGEAGKPEGDATMLGGPSFEDMENGIGAAPSLEQAPAAGGPRGTAPKKPTPAPMAAQAAQSRYPDEGASENTGDFGEEAPTEIFGDDPAAVAAMAAIAPPPKAAPSKPPASGSAKIPSMAPPARSSTPTGAPLSPGPRPTASAPAMSAAPGYQPPYGTPQGQPAMGEPEAGPQKTVLGMSAPILANYPGLRPQNPASPTSPPPFSQAPQGSNPGGYSPPGYPQPPQGQGQQPYQPYGGYGGYQGSGQQQAPIVENVGSAAGMGGHLSGQSMGSLPQIPVPQNPYGGMGGPMSGQMQSQPPPSGQHPLSMSGPSSGQLPSLFPSGATPVAVEGKKSTLGRDIGIGVGIAALVLVGFLVVKLVVLDDKKSEPKAASTLATVKLSMPKDMKAEMFVDDTRVGIFENDQSVGVGAGTKHVKLVGTNGVTCDDPKVALEAGKTTTLECGLGATPATGSATGSAAATPPEAPPAGSNAAAAQGSAAQGSAAATGSAGSASTGSAAAGSAVASAPETKPAETKPEIKPEAKPEVKPVTKVEPKVAETKPAEPKTPTTPPRTPTVTTTPKTPSSTPKTTVDSSKGYLTISNKTPAKILIDGSDTGLKTPVTGKALPLAPGKHKVTFVIGEDKYTFPVMIKAGATESLAKDL